MAGTVVVEPSYSSSPDPKETALPAPDNPYRHRSDGEAVLGDNTRAGIRTTGLSSERLDDMIRAAERARFSEGYDKGWRDQIAVRRDREPEVYDEGYDAGVLAGSAGAHGAVAKEVREAVLPTARAALGDLRAVQPSRLGRPSQDALRSARTLVEQVIDRLADLGLEDFDRLMRGEDRG